MYPDLVQFGKITIHWYGVFMALGFLAGLMSWIWTGRREGRDVQFCSDLLMWVILAGIGGARLAYVAANLPSFLANPGRILRVDEGGLIFYGGFIAAAIVLVVFALRRKEPILRLLDFAVVSVPLAHAFGRVGCLMNGCCYGAVCESPPGIRFPMHSLPWWRQVDQGLITRIDLRSLPVHPVQLYEAGANLLLYILLVSAYRRRRGADGKITALYLTLYPVIRYATEFLRGTDRIYIGFLSTAQAVSIALLAAGLIIWLMVYRAERRARAGEPG